MPDSSDIDNAVIAKLGSDAALLALCPNGVYWDLAPDGATRFVLVSLVDGDDVATFDQRPAVEDIVYAVTAVMRKDANGDPKAAAARINAVLVDQPLTAAGYDWIATYRDEDAPRIRYSERSDDALAVVWYHRGGNYRVQMGTH